MSFVIYADWTHPIDERFDAKMLGVHAATLYRAFPE